MTTENIAGTGLSATQCVDLLATDAALSAQKKMNYLDGEPQLHEMQKFLNENRKEWKARGFRPTYRNFTGMVVEKSCRVFETLPSFEIFDFNSTAPNEKASQALAEAFSRTDIHEKLMNLDSVVRLLKTAFVLVQFDQDPGVLTFDVLHRGNCAVIRSPKNTIDALIFRSDDDESGSSYRVFTKDAVVDLFRPSDSKQAYVQNEEPNPFGVVPVAAFYDTRTPRSGIWVDGGGDLVTTNESLNIHLVDTEFAAAFMKRPMAYTNADIDGQDGPQEVYQPEGRALPGVRNQTIVAGPDRMLSLSTAGGEPLVVEYKAPTVDLGMLDEVMTRQLQQVAADWSVNLKNGNGVATSGFQLVVEEIDNLSLRQQRQRMMEQGFKRLYRVLQRVLNTATGTVVLPNEADLFVEFDTPKLPVNEKDEIDVWEKKIALGVANKVDYLVAQGMTRDEAKEHLALIEEERESPGDEVPGIQ